MPTWTLSAFADEAAKSLDDQIAALQKAGLKHIDPRRLDGTSIVDLTVEDAKVAQTKLDAADIAVQMYGSPIGKSDVADDLQKELDRLSHLAKLKDVFGCDAVRMFSFYNKTGLDREAFKTTALEKLRQLRDHAGQLGLVLYLENESHLLGDHSDDMLMLAEELRDTSVFRVIYDFANYIRTGEEGWDTWQKMKGHTDCFHLKDQKKDGEHMPMCHGETDAARILKDAADAGWAGPCSVEPHLSMSEAVLATGVSGTGTKSMGDMDTSDLFHIACEAAKSAAQDAGATVG